MRQQKFWSCMYFIPCILYDVQHSIFLTEIEGEPFLFLFGSCNKIMYIKFQQISGSCSAHCCVSISGSVLIDFVSLDFVSFYILTEKQHLSVVVGAAVVVNFSLRMFLYYLGNRPVQIKKKVEQIHPYIFTSIYCFITDSYFLFINILHITTCT